VVLILLVLTEVDYLFITSIHDDDELGGLGREEIDTGITRRIWDIRSAFSRLAVFIYQPAEGSRRKGRNLQFSTEPPSLGLRPRIRKNGLAWNQKGQWKEMGSNEFVRWSTRS